MIGRVGMQVSLVGEGREKKVAVDDPAQPSFLLGLAQRGFESISVFEVSRVELTPPLPMQK